MNNEAGKDYGHTILSWSAVLFFMGWLTVDYSYYTVNHVMDEMVKITDY